MNKQKYEALKKIISLKNDQEFMLAADNEGGSSLNMITHCSPHFIANVISCLAKNHPIEFDMVKNFLDTKKETRQ